MIKTQEFTSIVGETYTTVRNVYGRPGREPRLPGAHGDVDFHAGKHRRYVFADAVAWRFVRHLSGFSLDWDTAAPIVAREQIADIILREQERKHGQFFAVWPVLVDGETQWAAWRGLPMEIAEIIEHDTKSGEIAVVFMVSCDKALREAEELANAAGYAVVDGELVARED